MYQKELFHLQIHNVCIILYSNFMYIFHTINFLVDVDQASQNYTFNFTLTGEPSDMIRFNFLNASNQSLIPHSCNSKIYILWISSDKFCNLGIVGTNYSCSIRFSESVGVGYHDITIQALRDEIVYGEITERFFVFRSMCFI